MVQILHILPFLHVKLEHCAVRVLALRANLKLSQGQLVPGLQVVICCLTRSGSRAIPYILNLSESTRDPRK